MDRVDDTLRFFNMAEAAVNQIPLVHVVDDDPVAAAFACGAAKAAGYASQTFDSAESFLASVDGSHRGCVILDLQMSGMNGLQMQGELCLRAIRLPVIVVSGRGDVSSAVMAMKQEAYDFFEKPVALETLAAAIGRAVAHDTATAHDRASAEMIRKRHATLSPREKQVMASVVDGMANKQIAAKLELSEKTIEVHRGNVMRKMCVESVAALVRASMVCDMPARDTGELSDGPRK